MKELYLIWNNNGAVKTYTLEIIKETDKQVQFIKPEGFKRGYVNKSQLNKFIANSIITDKLELGKRLWNAGIMNYPD